MKVPAAAVLAAAVLTLSVPQSAPLDDLARRALARLDGELTLAGLRAPVEVVRDEWGVPHISAANDDDLFLAQGFVVAQDRLWQMEMWRRAAEGRLAEVLGPEALPRDRIARLLRYRGPVDDEELSNYHPEARRLMTAFVRGVNVFIAMHADRLPVEFVLTGIRPEPWTIDTLLLRQVAFGDAASELQLARSVAELGPAEANQRRNPDPWNDLRVPEGLDVRAIGEDVVEAARSAGRVPPPDVLPAYRAIVGLEPPMNDTSAVREPGSNNWVVAGARSTTGKPVVVNDPHREVTLPSLRYVMHLAAPGWNVVGASEPPFIGVAIGHNERIGWGLTIVGTDQQDVYVERLNPSNPDEVRWKSGWEPLRHVREEIRVKGSTAETVELTFSRHGPVFFVDRAGGRAYALRSALHERGTAPYLAALRLAQVADCRVFLDAAMYWKAPSENLVCGDVAGNISWQASALTPRRNGWVGRLPVPGDGRYEWNGFRRDLPRELNPPRGLIVTANHNVQPKGYEPPLMFKNADTRFERITRLRQLLKPAGKYSLADHRRIQHDAYSLRAAAAIAQFQGWTAADPDVERARARLAAWDAVYTRDSAAPAIFEAWRDARPRGEDPPDRAVVEQCLEKALARLRSEQGPDEGGWRWGRMHVRAFPHPFVRAFDLPTVERAGGAGTVAADGATYREILDVSNWDASLTINTPGQSGQPGSPYYGNLLPLWTDNRYFPMVFSRDAIAAHAAHTLRLTPSP